MTWIVLSVFLAGGGFSGVLYLLLQRAKAQRDMAQLEARNAREKLAELGAVAANNQARSGRTVDELEAELEHERKERAAAVRTDADAAALLRDRLSPAPADPDDPTDPGLSHETAAVTPTGRKPGGVN